MKKKPVRKHKIREQAEIKQANAAHWFVFALRGIYIEHPVENGAYFEGPFPNVQAARASYVSALQNADKPPMLIEVF